MLEEQHCSQYPHTFYYSTIALENVSKRLLSPLCNMSRDMSIWKEYFEAAFDTKEASVNN